MHSSGIIDALIPASEICLTGPVYTHLRSLFLHIYFYAFHSQPIVSCFSKNPLLKGTWNSCWNQNCRCCWEQVPGVALATQLLCNPGVGREMLAFRVNARQHTDMQPRRKPLLRRTLNFLSPARWKTSAGCEQNDMVWEASALLRGSMLL